MLLKNIKGRTVSLFPPVMLITNKFMKDKRVVADFIHLNVKNSQEQLSISIIKGYIFSIR